MSHIHGCIGPGQHRPGLVPLQVMLIIKVRLQFGVCITQCQLRVNFGMIALYKTAPPFSVADAKFTTLNT